MKANLTEKVAVVTGGTRSIGKAIARKLAESGAKVVINGRDEKTGRLAEEELRRSGGEVTFVAGDMNSYPAVTKVVDTAVAKYGRLDILVCSGAARGTNRGMGLFKDIPVEAYPDNFQVHVWAGRLYPLRAALNHMLPRKYGKVVFLTTEAGRTPTPGETLNGSAAAALIFFTRAAGRELARDGIRLNTISTTLTKDTPAWEGHEARRNAADKTATNRAFDTIEKRASFGLVELHSLAELALYLSSEESDQISGLTFSVTGGSSFP